MRDPHRAWRTWGHVIGAPYRQWRCRPCPPLPAWVPPCQGLALLRRPPSDRRLTVPAAGLSPPPNARGRWNSDASRIGPVAGSGPRAFWFDVTLLGRGRRAGYSVGPCFQNMSIWTGGQDIFLILPGGSLHLKHAVSITYSRGWDIFPDDFDFFFQNSLYKILYHGRSYGIRTEKKHYLVSTSGLEEPVDSSSHARVSSYGEVQ